MSILSVEVVNIISIIVRNASWVCATRKLCMLLGKVQLGGDLFWTVTLAHVSGNVHPFLYPYYGDNPEIQSLIPVTWTRCMEGVFVCVFFLSEHNQADTGAGYLSNPKKAGLEARTFIFFPAQVHWPNGPSDALVINTEPIDSATQPWLSATMQLFQISLAKIIHNFTITFRNLVQIFQVFFDCFPRFKS